jgi:hypothetical protein
MSKVEIKPVKSKYLPKAFMLNEKIKFSQQEDRETGEIIYKECQATIYAVKGFESDFMPKACLTLKLGNNNLFLMGEDFDELEAFCDHLGAFIAKNKVKCNQTLAKEKSAFHAKQNSFKRAKSDFAIK